MFKVNFVSSVLAIAIMTLLLASSTAQGALNSFEATSSSSVKLFQGGQIIDQASQEKSFPGSGSVPLDARASISGPANSSQTLFAGIARTMVNDPQYNHAIPADFIIETAAGANDGISSLEVTAIGRQKRNLTVLSGEVDNAPAGQSVQLGSTFFLDGILAAIVPENATGAQGLEVSMNLDIMQNDTISLFSGAVSLIGQADGSVGIEATGDFAVSVVSALLTVETTTALGEITIAIFNELLLPFSYDAIVGQPFDLTAVLTTNVHAAIGTGGGTAFGTVPNTLIDLAEELFPEQQGTTAAKVPAGQLTGSAEVVPEPGSLILLGLGIFGGFVRKSTGRRCGINSLN